MNDTADRFDQCGTCGHHRGEHLKAGPCICDVLISRRLQQSRWERCSCAAFVAPDQSSPVSRVQAGGHA